MPQMLFNTLYNFRQQLETDNLDIYSICDELKKIVELGRQNNKLHIITQFFAIMESLARNYQYESADTLVEIKSILKSGVILIIQIIDGQVSNLDGAYKMEVMIRDIRVLLVKKLELLYLDEGLLIQFSFDIEKYVTEIRNLFKSAIIHDNIKQYHDSLAHYLQKLQESVSFVGVESLEEFMKSLLKLVHSEYEHNRFEELGSHADFLLSLEYLDNVVKFINNYYTDKNRIAEYFKNQSYASLQKRLDNSVHEYKNTDTKAVDNHLMVLTEEEIAALMESDYPIERPSFKTTVQEDVVPEPEEVSNTVAVSPDEYQKLMKNSMKIKPVNADEKDFIQEDLIKYLGRFFQKQIVLKEALTEEKKIELEEDLIEIDTLLNNIKKNLFDTYYISVKSLFGDELREYIETEVKSLGKKIRLGIRGEISELMVRDKEFIKDIVFNLVKNSLHHSIEPAFRRRAVDKNETAWLLIEFEDAGNMFDIYIRDDGRGVVPEMNLPEIEERVVAKNGIMEVDAVDSEYLKIHIQLPMPRVFMQGLVVQLGQSHVLIPDRCIRQIINVNDAIKFHTDENYLGQVNLSTLLGLEHSSTNMVVVCEFSNQKILFGVDQILYNMEAFVEDIEIPLIPGADTVTILNDGSIGFILNERKIYQMAKSLILSRDQQ